jgi:hypothetical protein
MHCLPSSQRCVLPALGWPFLWLDSFVPCGMDHACPFCKLSSGPLSQRVCSVVLCAPGMGLLASLYSSIWLLIHLFFASCSLCLPQS